MSNSYNNLLDFIANIFSSDLFNILRENIVGVNTQIEKIFNKMDHTGLGYITDISNITELKTLFINNGWTTLTAICVMLFSILHFIKSTDKDILQMYNFFMNSSPGGILCEALSKSLSL